MMSIELDVFEASDTLAASGPSPLKMNSFREEPEKTIVRRASPHFQARSSSKKLPYCVGLQMAEVWD